MNSYNSIKGALSSIDFLNLKNIEKKIYHKKSILLWFCIIDIILLFLWKLQRIYLKRKSEKIYNTKIEYFELIENYLINIKIYKRIMNWSFFLEDLLDGNSTFVFVKSKWILIINYYYWANGLKFIFVYLGEIFFRFCVVFLAIFFGGYWLIQWNWQISRMIDFE